MTQKSLLTHAVALALAGLLAVNPALADKPSWAGEKAGKDRGDEHRQERDGPRGQDGDRGDGAKQDRRSHRGDHFDDQRRAMAHEYYASQFHSGRCPPGLAKKHNGCMPPGQARKWEFGRPLPRDLVYYEVPRPLVERLGPPPEGHRYVRVAGDILMIAIGTALIVDAIEDVGR
ncbi:MAG: RcnB family protein [Sterolibacterium sp.]